MEQKKQHEIVDNLSYHLENAPCGILLWDSNLHVTYCSAHAAALFEWPANSCTQPFDFSKLVQQPDEEKLHVLLEDITKGGQLHNVFNSSAITQSGRLIYCRWFNSALKDEQGRVVNILSIVQNITDQKQTEIDLQKSQQQLSLIYNSAIDPMWLIAVEGVDRYRFETINDSFTIVTGLSKEKVIGMPIENILPPSSHALVRGKYNEAVRTGNIIDYIEEAMHPAGIKYGEIRVIPIRDENGQVTKLVGIANDITDKVLLQQSLDKERDKKNQQITKAAIKGQELERAKVSRELHDNVNQVLTTIKLYMELCMAGEVDTNEVLGKCTNLLNETITEIRSLSKELFVPSLGEVSLKDTLTDLIETIRATRAIDIKLDFALDGIDTVDDELHLSIYRILQEQLTNIIKHANARHVTIRVLKKEASLELTIKDDGVGFDQYQKASGIGITNMKSRAQMLNGTLEIKSEKGKGTCLTAVFPVEIHENHSAVSQTEPST